MGNVNSDFAMERRLRELSPDLHRRFTDAVFALQYTLSRYKLIFPEYTDHTNLHSMSVIDFCNRLIGSRIEQLNADELYALLMGCYFHDTGMGISMKDYEEFSGKLDFGDYFDTHSREDCAAVIRDFHQEYSGCFIRKYAELFEIPSGAHIQAIVQIARGHRRTNLMDEKEYPFAFPMPGGNTVCLPYLAALIRLADEIDVAAARNPILLYDIETLTDAIEIIENKKVKAVKDLKVTDSSFVMTVEEGDPEILEHLRRMKVKMQTTLDTCREAVCGRTPYRILQEKVILEII
ncbi:MAG: hypothetical protein Q4D81_10655 [Eubacteriales bacterium]|nr:hypothetical protein [Eubacteriales bacterium]